MICGISVIAAGPVARAAFRKRHGVADLHLHKLDEPLVIAWRRVLAIEVIDDFGQVAGQPLAFGFGHAAPPQQGSAFPDTGQNTLMLPMCALSAPRQCKPLESHGLVRTARVHLGSRRRGGVAACRRCAIDDAANPSDDTETAPDRGGARQAYRLGGPKAWLSIKRWLGRSDEGV